MIKNLITATILASGMTYNVANVNRSQDITLDYDVCYINRDDTDTLGWKYKEYKNETVEIYLIKRFTYEYQLYNLREIIRIETFVIINPLIDFTQCEINSYVDQNKEQNLVNSYENSTSYQADTRLYRETTVTNEEKTTVNNFITLFKEEDVTTQEAITKLNEMRTICTSGTNLTPNYQNEITEVIDIFGNYENITYDIDVGNYTTYYSEIFIDSTNAQNFIYTRGVDITYGLPENIQLQLIWDYEPQPTPPGEYLDLGGLFLTILGMPMAWITQAFNFTFWEGTNYALNVGHILSAIVIASVIIIVIKKVYK